MMEYDPDIFPGTAEEFATYQSIKNRIFATGLYLRRTPEGEYQFRPKGLANRHKALCAQLRPWRDYLIKRIESHVAFDILVAAPEADFCTHCHEKIVWLDIEGLRKRGDHHLPDGSICPQTEKPSSGVTHA